MRGTHSMTLRHAVLAAAIVAGITTAATAADGQLRMARIFQDNMVLQREMPVPVWGWAAPGATVEVSFAGQKEEVRTDEQGRWKAVLEPMAASREGRVLEAKVGDASVSVKDVLVGEVWMAAGQSNMVAGGPDTDTGVYPHYVSPGTQGGKPEIRVCDSLGWSLSLEPLDDYARRASDGSTGCAWEAMQENPPAKSMGPAYYFARVVRDGLDVPVGLVLTAVSGTPQTTWMARETLESFPPLDSKSGAANYYQELLTFHTAKAAESKGLATFEAYKKAEAEWLASDARGRAPGFSTHFPSSLYNARIHPLAPFAFRGVIWHQGEGGPGGPYGERLVAMVKQWRTLFGHDFVFLPGTLARLTTQAPPLAPMCSGFYRSNTNEQIRHACELFGGDKNVALVELYDLGYWETHFLQKAEMGRRMGLAALAVAYGQKHVYTGPQMVKTDIEGGKVTLRFEHVGDGLVYQPSIDGISGVYLRGKDGTSRWANVTVVGKDTIEVWHPDIAAAETVAYAANVNPHETILNSAGIPATPFTVNPSRGKDEAPPYQLVSLEGDASGLILHIPHVRRHGYVFQPKPGRGKKQAGGPVTVEAYIPAEWKGYEVEADGKPIEVTEKTRDGARFVTFKAVVDGPWVIVAETGHAAEFRKVNRY
ncbi:MAG: hypothetical protein JXL80_03755 [Planctomycetes bacterium]|nr:hypothetical protein [Planctomycetota bacterium]